MSLGIGNDWVLFDLGDLYVHTDQTALTGRAEIEDQVTKFWKSFIQMDLTTRTTVKYQLPISVQSGRRE